MPLCHVLTYRYAMMKSGGNMNIDDTFDEYGKHRLGSFPSDKIQTKIEIDFDKKFVQIMLIIPKVLLMKGTEEDDDKKENNELLKAFLERINAPFVTEYFKISADLKTITTNNYVYNIPKFFNRELIKTFDVKIWEMLFYQIFDKEIAEMLYKVRSLLKQKKNRKIEENN